MKTRVIAVTFLVFAFFSYGIILAQQQVQQSDPLIKMRAENITAIKELEKRENLSPEESKALEGLKKNKQEIEKKMRDLRIGQVEQDSSSAKDLEEQQKRIRVKELGREASEMASTTDFYLDQEGIRDMGLRAKIKAKVLAAKPTDPVVLKSEVEKEAVVASVKEAIAKGSADACNGLLNEHNSSCESMYFFYTFLSGLMKENKVTPGVVDSLGQLIRLVSERQFTDPQIEQVANAFLTRDISKAEAVLGTLSSDNKNYFLALISRDSAYCAKLSVDQEDCFDGITYISAIKSGDCQTCAKMKNETWQAICREHFNR